MSSYSDDAVTWANPANRSTRVRSALVRIGILLAFAVLTLQLWRLQIVDNRQYATAAEGNRIRLSPIAAPRGVIYDRNHTLLAMNSPSFVVAVTEADVPSDRRTEILEETAQILGVSVDDIEQVLSKKHSEGVATFRAIPVVENVSRDLALQLEEQSWALPGVSVQVAAVRSYAGGDLFSHLLGYTALPSADAYGQTYEPLGYDIEERV